MTQRLDVALTERGLVRSRRHAQDAISAGHVSVNGRPASRASLKVQPEDSLEVASEADLDYVSRAGHKLAGVLNDLGAKAPVIGGKRCLDVGASTGGFTDVLLQHGAEHVVAIDVGHDQLRPELQNDPRVTSHEGINARYLDSQLVAPAPEIAVADVSFISLTLLLEPIIKACAPGADLLLMVKPQFEVGKERLGAQGVVRSAALHVEAVAGVAAKALELGCEVHAVVRSQLPGPNGNIEYFLHLSTPPVAVTHTYDEVVAMITNAVQGSDMTTSTTRSALVVTHSGRSTAIEATREATAALTQAGFEVTQYEDSLAAAHDLDEQYRQIAADAEIVVVLGGDGTILRAAELVHGAATPILGINLGHVGFLAESELGGLRDAVSQIADRNYTIDERGTIDVVIRQSHDAPEITEWALNEAALEKANRERMIEVVIEVDQRPVSTFGCDGVVVSTATGSTAHAFSAGGPIMWPNVDGMVLVPISAHALFARPMVVGPDSMVAIDVTTRTDAKGLVTLDGRRSIELQPTGRLEVRRGEHPIRLVRLNPEPFTDRLVSKFNLPVAGWRGPINDPAEG